MWNIYIGTIMIFLLFTGCTKTNIDPVGSEPSVELGSSEIIISKFLYIGREGHYYPKPKSFKITYDHNFVPANIVENNLSVIFPQQSGQVVKL